MKDNNYRILDFIHNGEQNAVTMRELSMLLDIDQRQVRHMIEQARISGIVIAGTDAGIFFPVTHDELREYVNRTQSRINTSIATLKPAIRMLEGQCDE